MSEIRKVKRIEQGSIHAVSIEQGSIHAVSVDTAIIHWEGDPYEGSYEVTPRFSEQSLSTYGKIMRDDVTVHTIPVTRTSNPQGGLTVIIG